MHLADVTNARKMELIFKEFHPEIVFHAAAYKHVPLMEENPHEALRVNVGGTKIITELSVKYGVKKFVMISTDKSVNPSSVMGASKRVCEMIVQSRAQAGRSERPNLSLPGLEMFWVQMVQLFLYSLNRLKRVALLLLLILK